ncbi:MAG: hypothetical protein ACREO5_13590, partial [Candidatus Binatia bacterium]
MSAGDFLATYPSPQDASAKLRIAVAYLEVVENRSFNTTRALELVREALSATPTAPAQGDDLVERVGDSISIFFQDHYYKNGDKHSWTPMMI